MQKESLLFLILNNLTTSQSNKQFRTTIGHLPDSIGRTPDVTHFYFVYNYSCNKEPGTARTKNSTPALVRNRARMLTISSLIFLREMWFGIPSLLCIFVGHVPTLFCKLCSIPGIPVSRKRAERNEWDAGDILSGKTRWRRERRRNGSRWTERASTGSLHRMKREAGDSSGLQIMVTTNVM